MTLLLRRSVLLAWILIALLMMCCGWVRRGATVRVVALLVLVYGLGRSAIAVLGLPIGTIGRGWVRALYWRIGTVIGLAILIMLRLSIALRLRGVALVIVCRTPLSLAGAFIVLAIALLALPLTLPVVVLACHVAFRDSNPRVRKVEEVSLYVKCAQEMVVMCLEWGRGRV